VGIIHQRRKAETRSLLVAAGLELFAERGFDIATLDEVALAAGFTKGAIYRHFPSKGTPRSRVPVRAHGRRRGSFR